MMRKNRILSLVLCVVICMGLFSGCGSNSQAANKKYSIVCTIFPEYDWAKQVLGDDAANFDLTLLLDSGVDLHNYQPTADDIIKISNCDIFVYVGGESDEWVEDALKEATNKNMQVMNLLEVLGGDIKEEELVEGMQGEEEEVEEEVEEGPEYDEHVWLSLKNAQVIVNKIKDAVCNVDKDNSDKYEKNASQYISQLSDLDSKYEDAVKKENTKTVLFGDRFPFRYLVEDYDLEYYAAFVGCSAETEASFGTITFLAKKVDELGLSSIFVLEGSDQKIAETIIQNTKDKNQQILVLDSMQSTTSGDIEEGATYIKAMEKNLEALQNGLK